MKDSFYTLIVFTFCFCLVFNIQAQLSHPELIYDGAEPLEKVLQINLNNDTIIDIIYSRETTGHPHWDHFKGSLYKGIGYYKNNGSLAFRTTKISEDIAHDIDLFDFDNDGDEDILVTLDIFRVDHCFKTYENRNGNFVETDMLPSFLKDTCLRDVHIQDLDNNGLKDFILEYDINFNQEEDIYVKYQTQAGIYSTKLIAEDVNFSGSYDVNQDGIFDFVIDDGQNKKLLLFMSTSTFQFEEIILDSLYESGFRFVADIDYDGENEVVMGEYNWTTHYVLDNISFNSTPTKRILFQSDNRHAHVKWIDVNADGFLDGHDEFGKVNWINDGKGSFTKSNASIIWDIDNIIYAELDTNDQSAYYLYHKFENPIIAARFKNGEWYENIVTTDETFIRQINKLQTYDLNNDGYPEHLFSTWAGDALMYFKGLPNNQLGELKVIEHVLDVQDFCVADFNGDGNLDIAYIEPYIKLWNSDLYVIYGDGNGGFSDKTLLQDSLTNVNTFAAGDFENDGYADILLKLANKSTLYRLNNIDGNFQPLESFSSIHDCDEMHVHDIDLDGDLDIALMCRPFEGLGRWFILKNDGMGGFRGNPWPGYEYNFASTLRDFNKDGKVNLIRLLDNTIFVDSFYKYGTEEILSFQLTENINSHSMLLWDYNWDGRYDIMLQDEFTLDVHLYRNLGDTTFEYDSLFSDRFGYELVELMRNKNYFMINLENDNDYDLLYVDHYDIYNIRNLKGIYSISGTTYWDENGDGIYNSNDISIGKVELTLEDDSGKKLTFYSDEQGNYTITPASGNYELSARSTNNCWEVIQPNTRNVTLANSNITDENFGFELEGIAEKEPLVHLSRAPTRCGFEVRYYVTIQNKSCQFMYGEGVFTLDSKISNIANVSLTNFTINGNEIHFTYGPLLPGERLKFYFDVRIPGVEHRGESLVDRIRLDFDYDDGTKLDKYFEQKFISTIRCAYDPNDKLVFPDRSAEFGSQYVTNEDLIYTIRFQNTGNDTAFNVELKDTISNKLDLNTFQPVDASHMYELILNKENRVLSVLFNNIQLPDSSINYKGSNGFFTYKIQPREDLVDFIDIYNSAGIFFDYNPAIVTNETKVEYVTDLSILLNNTNHQSESRCRISPNPALDVSKVLCIDNIKEVVMYDLNGGEVFRKKMENNILQLADLVPGMYIVKVHTESNIWTTKLVKM